MSARSSQQGEGCYPKYATRRAKHSLLGDFKPLGLIVTMCKFDICKFDGKVAHVKPRWFGKFA